MSSFRASEYGIEWPTDPTEIVQEALRDYVGDGDGADKAVLDAHDTQVAVRALRRAADELMRSLSGYSRETPQTLAGRGIIARLRERADQLDAAS